jgi:hypothetical protein
VRYFAVYKMATVMDCNYSEKVGVMEKILVFVLISETFLNFRLELGK